MDLICIYFWFKTDLRTANFYARQTWSVFSTYIWWSHCLHLFFISLSLGSATICFHLRIQSGVFEHRCVPAVIQLTYEDRIIPSSLTSKWITTTDLFSARHHDFWWEDEVQAMRVDGTVSQKRWPEHCYRNIRCTGKLGKPRKWVIAGMQRSSKRSVSSRSSKEPFHQRKRT